MEKKDYLLRLYYAASSAGLCSTKTEFAKLLDVNRATISAAFAGNEDYLTDKFFNKLRLFAKAYDLEASLENIPQPAKPSAAPEVDELLATIASQQRTIERLTQILAAQTGTAIGAPIAAAAQKNWQTKKEI